MIRAAALALFAIFGCESPRTEVVLVVDADREVAARADRLVVRVEGGPGLGPFETSSMHGFAVATTGWPVEVGIVPAGGDAARIWRATATAYEGDSGFVSARVITGFLPGRTLTHRVVLEASCVGHAGCSDDRTCRRGDCVPAEVPVGDLSTHGGRGPRFDAGVACTPRSETCNAIDDDCDGLVDEGSTYTARAPASSPVREGIDAALWWVGRGPDSVVAVWQAGLGTTSDHIRVAVFDFSGNLVGETVVVDHQPSNWNRAHWVDRGFVLHGTMRSYQCPTEDTCPTYLAGIDAVGMRSFAPTVVVTGTPTVAGSVAVGGELLVVFTPRTLAGTITVRSYGATGAPGRIERDLLPTGVVETIGGYFVPVVAGDRILWVYESSLGVRLLVTDLEAVPVGSPRTLVEGGELYDRGGTHAVFAGGALHVGYHASGTAYVARFDTTGEPIGDPLPLHEGESRSLGADADHLHVLTRHADERHRYTRLSASGGVAQPPTVVDGDGDTWGIAAVPDGALVFMPGRSTVEWRKLACP